MSTSTLSPAMKLAYVWIVFFVASLTVPFVMAVARYIEFDHLLDVLKSLGKAYGANLGVVISYCFTQRKDHTISRNRRHNAIWLAILASGVWNSVLLTLLVMCAFGKIPVTKAIDTIDTAMPLLSWLVAPVIGYFFSTDAKDEAS